jgi:hypothetical protein
MDGINFVFISKEHSAVYYNERFENVYSKYYTQFSFFFSFNFDAYCKMALRFFTE